MAVELTVTGKELHHSLPPVLRGSIHYRALVHAYSKFFERLEARLEELRDEFFPQRATTLLKAWEAELGLPIEAAGFTLAERRTLVAAYIRKLSGDPSGRSWVRNITLLAGPNWYYREHVPGDITSPPANTIRIILGTSPASTRYAILERLIRDITPAHLDIEITFDEGFLLDISQLDQEGLHF